MLKANLINISMDVSTKKLS